MKSLLQKLAYLFLILILIKLPFVLFYDDEFVYGENKPIPLGETQHLLRYIEQQVNYRKSEIAKQNFDTVFIGSSRTHNSIIPPYFDALNKKNTKSYNYGIGYGFPPHTFDWCEELIQTKSSLKHIFFELSELSLVSLKPPKIWEIPVNQLDTYLDSLVISAFKPRQSAMEDKIVDRKGARVTRRFTEDYNITLQAALEKVDQPADEFVSPEKIHFAYLRNSQVEKDDYAESYPLDKIYWARVLRLIELAESKQIQIYFFIPPRLANDNELKMIYPIYQKLEQKYKLKILHDESLYQVDTSFDDFHLNHKGAKRFTELVAESFNNHSH